MFSNNQSLSEAVELLRRSSRASQGADCRSESEQENEFLGLAQIIEEDPNPVLRVAEDGTLLYANRGSWLLLAYWNAEIGDTIPADWIQRVQDTLAEDSIREFETQVGYKTILLFLVPIAAKGYVNLYGLDVTRRKHVEEKLLLNAQVFENATEGVMITDPELRIIDVNRAFCAITGYSREEILGESAQILESDRHDRGFYEEMWRTVRTNGSWQGEIWDRRKNGEIYPKWLSLSSVTDEHGEVSRYIALFSDITVRKQSEDQLYHMAHYDSLTGLANRKHFQDVLEATLKTARRTGDRVVVMFLDLDGFKLVNDNLGHRAGDLLLVEVASRIKSCVRESDTVARMGGDEFTVLLPNLHEPANAARIARKILAQVCQPIQVEGKEVFVSSSIGIAVYPEDIADAESLLQGADAAMYSVKQRGKNSYQFFSRTMNTRAAERLLMQTSLHHAIEAREFVVHYQPQVNAETGLMTGVEALVRWHSAERGLLLPADFISLAEESGLICEIGEQVLRAACLQGMHWQIAGQTPLRIGVNISPQQVRRPDFVPIVESILAESGLPADRLEIELTENMLIDDNPETLSKLLRMKELGISLAIDDFGTKYSSLAYLKLLPVNRIKIDRAFVQDICFDARGKQIVSAIIAIGRSLGLEVVAEGVETEQQLSTLREMGCPCVQGNYYSKPVEASAISARLAGGTPTVGRSGSITAVPPERR